MHECAQAPQMSGLGFSWKTPDWLKRLVSTAGAAARGTYVTVGGKTYNLTDPADVAALKALASGVKISTTAPQPQAPALIESVPGGWSTVGLGVAALLIVGYLMMGKRRG